MTALAVLTLVSFAAAGLFAALWVSARLDLARERTTRLKLWQPPEDAE